MGMGLVDASPDSVAHLLKNNKSVMIVVGGAAEALDARPGKKTDHSLTIQHSCFI